MELRTINETTLQAQNFGEYSWVESVSAETDAPTVDAYLTDCDVTDYADVTEEYSGRIHNQPNDAVIIQIGDEESSSLHMYWFD